MWPQLITRYVIAELLKVFLVGLTVFTVFMAFVGVAQEAIRQGLGLIPILRLTPYALLNGLVYALPATVLFSACSVFGRMSSDNEIMAIKSMGVSPAAVTRPALAFAMSLSLVSVWVIDVAFSWGYWGVQRVVVESMEDIAYGVLRTQGSYHTERLSITVAGVEDHRLLRPAIDMTQNDGSLISMRAREAQLYAEPEQGGLRISLTDGTVQLGAKAVLRFPDTIEHVIPLTSKLVDQSMSGSPSHMRLAQVPVARAAQRERILRVEQSLVAVAAYQLFTGEFDALADAQWKARGNELDRAKNRLFRLESEPYRRWASGFSCLAFVMVGVPLAIRLKTSDLMTTFGVSFMPILILYYPLFAFGLDRSKNGALPPYSVWLGNLVCFAVGTWLLGRVAKH